MNSKESPSGGRLKIIGLISIALGIISIASPAVAAGAVVMVVGLVMLASGIPQIVQGFKQETKKDKMMSIILGTIGCVAGMLVLAHPLLGLGFLTLLLSGFFVVEGLWKIFTAFNFKPVEGWIWMLVGGVLSLVFALLIWKQWPLSGEWAIGILVGVDFLTSGLCLVVLGSALGKRST